MNIKVVSKALMIVLWLSTLSCALLWAFGIAMPFEPEPITVILGLVSAAVTGMMNEYAQALEKEEYSVSYALAYGYVTNFLEPVITAIIKQTPAGQKPKFYIYLPERLQELEPKSIDRTIVRLREKNLTASTVNIDLPEGRVRDVLTIDMQRENVYFDFPTTLLTLNSFIIYKATSAKNSFNEEEKIKLGAQFIDKFKATLIKMLAERDLDDKVFFVGKDLNF